MRARLMHVPRHKKHSLAREFAKVCQESYATIFTASL